MTSIDSKSKYKILVVEDDVGLQYLIKSKLEEENYEILTSTSGAEAVKIIKSEEIFLMLLDYKLTDITGKELLQQLSNENIEVPFIFMTGFGDERVAVEIMKLGAKEYLVKTGEFLNQIPVVVNRIAKEIENDEKFKRMQKELESLNNMKSHFLNMISQEIRTPLTGISGALHLLRNQEFSSTIKELLETLQNSVHRLDDFANKTILSTQLSSGNYQMNISDINVKELVQYCYLELTNEVMEKEVEITEDIDPNLHIKGDRDLLYKAFLYILENAVLITKPKTSVDIKFEKVNNFLKCSILDHGDVEIEDPADLLMNPFQTSTQDNLGNFGLSLFLINQIVEQHEGKIEIKNPKEAGMLIELYLNSNLQPAESNE
ncbi:MAG: hybrid sensor histidine kinase/response regulator [Bacteroidetes bacterium]|nr:hybrid sensor histidine kinase/response regulator [Bacteroidota bacterium]